MYNKLFIVLTICLGVSLATPLGAPTAACGDMTPQHNTTGQPLPSPYTFSVTSTPTGASITITATGGDYFRGFFIQARDINNVPVGTYTGPSNTHSIDCTPGAANAFTHSENSNKTSIAFTWNAPTPAVPVTFLATTCRITTEFYVAQNIGTWAPAN